jgi:outer membrane protein assembly factor BamD
MYKSFVKYLYIAVILFFVSSCSSYQKLLKSSDYNLKYEKAVEYYNKKDYFRAQSLFDELISVYKGTDKYEEIYYYYAYCYYGQGDYVLAGYYFKNYTITYPNGRHREECLFMSAKCYFLDSPQPTLDQANTRKAIDEFQLFINRYPNSERIKESTELMDKLRDKLETKSYLQAKLYFDLSEYKAAIQAIKISLAEFPDSDYREELQFLSLKSHFSLAENSVETKKQERFLKTMNDYHAFITEFPESKYLKDAERIYNTSKKQTEQIN